MKFSFILVGPLLLVSSAIASPMTASRQMRYRSRQTPHPDNRRGHLSHIISPSEANPSAHDSGNEYSTNWAGAVLIGTGFTSVTADFIVPTPKLPPGASPGQHYCAGAWVGIDGETCHAAILQTGVNICISGTNISYRAWYEWFPGWGEYFDNITIAAGDKIRATVNATSPRSGTATVENLSNGESVSQVFNGPVSGTLCEYNAEWIVEDFDESEEQVPFANFGAVTFSNARATRHGLIVGPSNVTLINLMQNNKVFTSTSITSDSVTVRYVEPVN